MTHASGAQIDFITSLAAKAGYSSAFDAINAYGLGLRSASSLTIREASEMIDFLKSGPAEKAPAVAVGATVKVGPVLRGTVTGVNGTSATVRFASGRETAYPFAELTLV